MRLRAEIDSLDRRTLDAVRPLLGNYEFGPDALTSLGYVVDDEANRPTLRIRWRGAD